MTFLVVVSGFENEGWKSTLRLVEPSLFADEITVYNASQPDVATLIEETMPLDERHMFIFLASQRATWRGDQDQKIEHYRIKKTIEDIKHAFPFVAEHTNVLLLADDHRHIVGSTNYAEKEKQIAFEIDKQGFTFHDNKTYFFSENDLKKLDETFEQFMRVEYSVMPQPHGREEIKRFERLKEEICTACKDLIVSKKKNLPDDADSKYSQLLETVSDDFCSKMHAISLERNESNLSKPSSVLAEILAKRFSVREEFDAFTVIEYPYRKDFDTRLFLDIISLVSILRHSDDKSLLINYWLRIANIEIDKDRLSKALGSAEGLRLKDEKIETLSIEINDIENLSLPSDAMHIEHVSSIDSPKWYSEQEEHILEELVDGAYNDLYSSMEDVTQHLQKIKKKIHNHDVARKKISIAPALLKEYIKTTIDAPKISYHDSIAKIKKEIEAINIESFTRMVVDDFRKIPRFSTYFGLLIMFWIVASVLYVVVNYQDFDPQKWQHYLFALLPIFLYVGAGSYFLFSMRSRLATLLDTYRKKLSGITQRLESWQNNTIAKYHELFRLKLEHENRDIFQMRYEAYKIWQEKREYHEERIGFLNRKAQELQRFFKVTSQVSRKEISPDMDKGAKEIMDYSLFREKTRVEEIVVDIGKYVRDIEAYGYISTMQLDKILNREATYGE